MTSSVLQFTWTTGFDHHWKVSVGTWSCFPKTETNKLLPGGASPLTDAEAKKIASQARVDIVIFGFLTLDDSGYQMRGVIGNMATGKADVTVFRVNKIYGLSSALDTWQKHLVTQLSGTSPRQEFRIVDPPAAGGTPRPYLGSTNAPRGPSAVPWRSGEISGAVQAIDVGNIYGDGRNEVVYLDQAGLTISRFEGEGLRPVGYFSEPPARYLSVEVEDLAGKGIAQILVCYQTDQGIESAVISYEKGQMRVLCRVPHAILRTVKDPADEKKLLLLGQRTDNGDMFSGDMVQFSFSDSKLVRIGQFKMPPGTLLVSQVTGRLGRSTSPLRAIINQDQRLMVFDGENRLLSQMSDRLYGFSRTLKIPVKGGHRTVTFPGKLLIADANGTGENELLVPKEGRGGSCVIQGLSWDGKQLAEKWRTADSGGIVSDFVVRDFKNNGRRSMILVLVIPPSPFPLFGAAGPRSVIFCYDLLP